MRRHSVNVLKRNVSSGHSVSRSGLFEKLNDPAAVEEIIRTLGYRIPIDPRQPLVTVGIRPDCPNISGGRGGDAIEPTAKAWIRSRDAAPVGPVPVLGLSIIANRPDVIDGDGSHRMQVFVDGPCIRNPIPAGAVPVIGQRRIAVPFKVTRLGITYCPDVAGGDG